MKKGNKHILFSTLILLIIIVFSACEFMSYAEYEPIPYDGALEWEEVIDDADWGNRFDHASVVYNNKMWVFGGHNPGKIFGDTYYEDVWNSEDGEKWNLVTEDAPWHGRRGHEVITFDDGSGEAMYLIGGFEVDESTGYRQYTNDVWKSTDGENWSQIKMRTYPPQDSLYDWFPRMEHSCGVKNIDGKDYIFLLAGRSMQDSVGGRHATIYHNDVWRSENGSDWERIENNDYGIRGDQAFTIDPQTGRMYLQGGTHGFTFSGENNGSHPTLDWHHLWFSDNGEEWFEVIDTAAMDEALLWRSSHQMLYYKDYLWVFPGKTTSNEHYGFTRESQISIWNYTDSEEFLLDSNGDPFDPRHGYSSLVFKDKIWILGGFTSSYGQSNDVWSGSLK